MGLGKSLRKAWKKTLGWVEDETKDYLPAIVATAGTIIGSAIAPGMGTAIGASIGSSLGQGIGQYRAGQQQEKAVKAQIESAERIAAMQNNTVVSAAPMPTQTLQKAAISEQNDATRKARAFRLANSVRSGTLGGGNSGKRKTLG